MNQLSLAAGRFVHYGQDLHALGCATGADVTNRASCFRDISHDFRIGADCLGHCASAGKHQRVVVALESVIVLSEVLFQEQFVSEAVSLEYRMNLGDIAERVLLSE